ncbi:MAG: DUF3386 family protein [Nitrospirae bacterium]|nr:DUF3386 family protein [Candidatus Troglogloeales bacterium]
MHGHDCCKETKADENVQNDPAAKALLKGAFDKTSRWGENFTGVTADLILNHNGTEYKGKVTIKSSKETDVSLSVGPEGEALLSWLKNQVGMMATHRASRPFEESDGKYSITFAKELDIHPLGRQICIHGDGMNSRYRIKDNRILQISRSMGKMRFTINIIEAMTTKDDKFLTTQYVVYYFTPEGQISQVENFTDTPFEQNGVYLPGIRRIISVEGGEVIVRVLEFKNHRAM